MFRVTYSFFINIVIHMLEEYTNFQSKMKIVLFLDLVTNLII